MFQKISIIGFGLIGSSIARKVKEISPETVICCHDQDDTVCETVLDMQLADKASTDPSIVKGSDLVILSVPVCAMKGVVESILPYIDGHSVLTDVGSVKTAVVRDIESILPDDIHFVAGHPIAGTEFSGPKAGFASLFENKLWLLTPTAMTSAKALQVTQEFCEALGAHTKIMAPDIHDKTLAMTSHLPQLISYMMINAADELGNDLNMDVISCSANGFHGFARIAASDPVMWRDVYLSNKDNVLDVIDRFQDVLSHMRATIENEDGQHMHDFFSASRKRHLEHLESKKL